MSWVCVFNSCAIQIQPLDCPPNLDLIMISQCSIHQCRHYRHHRQHDFARANIFNTTCFPQFVQCTEREIAFGCVAWPNCLRPDLHCHQWVKPGSSIDPPTCVIDPEVGAALYKRDAQFSSSQKHFNTTTCCTIPSISSFSVSVPLLLELLRSTANHGCSYNILARAAGSHHLAVGPFERPSQCLCLNWPGHILRSTIHS